MDDINEMKLREEQKIAYLQMIQEPISRMSTISAVLKGFAATTVTGIAAISFMSIETVVLVLLLFPVTAFMILDIYYLQLERRFRALYEQVRKNEHPIDYSMALSNTPEDIKKAKATYILCFESPAIWRFYVPIYITLVVIIILDYAEVI